MRAHCPHSNMSYSQADGNATEYKTSSPALQPHHTGALFSSLTPTRKAAGIVVPSQGSNTRRVRESFTRVVNSDTAGVTSDRNQAGAETTSLDHAGPLSLEAPVAALHERRLAREARALSAAGFEMRTSAASVGVATVGTHRAPLYSATSEHLAESDYMAPLCPVSSPISSISTIASSESQMSHHSFTVFSVRDSPPSHPYGHAPMNTKTGPAQPDRHQRAAAEMLSPLAHPIDNAHVLHRSDSDETSCFTNVASLHTTLDANCVTSPASVATQHLSPLPLMHSARMATAEQDAECCFFTTSTPEASVLPSAEEVQAGPLAAISSSADLPPSCGTDNRLCIDASLQYPAYGLFMSTNMTRIRPFAPFSCRSTTPSRENCASPQPLSQDQSWRDSIAAGVHLCRDSPHTRRMENTSHECLYSGCFTTACRTSSPEAWDGLLRSESADRETSLRSALSAEMPIFTCRHRMTPSPPRATTPPPLLSSALCAVFLAEVVRSKHKLLDGTAAALRTAPADRDIIADHLAMQHRLRCLKWEMTKQQTRWRRGGYVRTL